MLSPDGVERSRSAGVVTVVVSGGIAERARFGPQLVATGVIVGAAYPLFEGAVWGDRFGFQAFIERVTEGPLKAITLEESAD